MTISHGFIYIRQAEFKRQLLNSTSKSGRTTHTLPQITNNLPHLFVTCNLAPKFLLHPEFTCSTRDTVSTQDIRAAKGMKMFPLGDGELSGVRLRSFNMASPHTEVHSQLGTNSGASALKDAAETPPLGPFA